MEEWHQKLHNNTTPDDVPICSAYIAFLEVRWLAGHGEPMMVLHCNKYCCGACNDFFFGWHGPASRGLWAGYLQNFSF